MRAELVAHRAGAGFSSGGSSETRNILFITPGDATGRWLLPDHRHVIAETSDVLAHVAPADTRTVATVALVKTPGSDAGGGRLLLFDPSGKHVVEVAQSVRTLHEATMSTGDLRVLFERDRDLFLASFDPESLAKRDEQRIQIPQLEQDAR